MQPVNPRGLKFESVPPGTKLRPRSRSREEREASVPSPGEVEAFAAGFVNVVNRDIHDALPVFEGTFVALVTRPARQPPFHDDIVSPKRSVPIAARRAEYRNDRRPRCSGKMHRTRVPAHKQLCSLAQRDKLFQRRRNFADAISGRADQVAHKALFARTPRYRNGQSVINQPRRELAVSFGLRRTSRPLRSTTIRFFLSISQSISAGGNALRTCATDGSP